MTSNEIISLMNRVPFTSMHFRLNDGRSVTVSEPFQVSTRRNSPICLVYDDDGGIHHLSIRNITEIITEPNQTSD